MLRDTYDVYTYPCDANDNDYSEVINIIELPGEWSESKGRDAIRDDSEFTDCSYGCSHEHDCCGCWFRSGYELHLIYHGEYTQRWMLRRTYSRNV
jgi:hypothetical protein